MSLMTLKKICILLVCIMIINIYIILRETLAGGLEETLCLPDTHLDHCLTSTSLCEGNNHFDVVVVIDSAIKSFQNREAIRATWGNESHYFFKGYKVKVFFTLGNPDLLEDDVREKVLRERDEHFDIIFINIEESYKNIIHKVMYGLRFAVRHCPNTDMVVKADDDIFVDIPRLYDTFMGDPSLSSSVWCTSSTNSPNRVPKTKWYVDPRIYGKDYPHYCLGSFYTLNMTSLTILMGMAYCEPWFWIDDVFVTGDLRSKANLTLKSMSDKDAQFSSGYRIEGKEVDNESAKDLKILYHHLISPAAMRYLWSLVMLAFH